MTVIQLLTRFVVTAVTCVGMMQPAFSGDTDYVYSKNPVWNGILSSFDVPLDELLVKKNDSEWHNLFDGFSGRVGFNQPLRRTIPDDAGSGTQGIRSLYSTNLFTSLRYNPLGNWFAEGSLYYYLDEKSQTSWNPDYSYSFGYNDWRPYTFSLIYSNNKGNRLSPENGEKSTEFLQGTYSLGWKFLLLDELAKPMLLDESKDISCQFNYNLTPRYTVYNSDVMHRYKRSLSLGCQYPVWKHFYIEGTAYYYPSSDQQQPWDPDYSYGFGYNNFLPGSLAVEYSNYSGNRFPWKENTDTGNFKDGTVSVYWKWAWE